MFNPFKKKEETPSEEGIDEEDSAVAPVTKPSKSEGSAGTASLTKLSTEVDRLKVAAESFSDVRKSLTERISGISEQIGELRAMILDRDRTIQEVELKAIKASDLVETVQPEKLMIEVQKEDAKFEALKANLEGNESIMDRVLEELREMRKKIETFKGLEEVIKLSEEVRKELTEIKKVEASVGVSVDKIETIYSELRKYYQDASLFSDNLQDATVKVNQNMKDINSLKVRMTEFAKKDDVEKLVLKVQKAIDSFNQMSRNSSLSQDISRLKSMLDNLR